VDNNLTIGPDARLTFKVPNGTFRTGIDGVLNEGRIDIQAETAPIDVVFYAGSNVTNRGVMHIIDISWLDYIDVGSSSPGTQWHLIDETSAVGEPYFFHAKVSDSDASNGNTVYSPSGYSWDAGNNDNWVFSYRYMFDLNGLEGHPVNLTIYRYGSMVTQTDNSTLAGWADENTWATLQDEYVVTTNEERYYTEATTSWYMDENVSATVTYYHQWRPSITLNRTDSGHTVTAYYTSTGATSSQGGVYGTWSRWVDNGSALSFSRDATGTPARHTGEDFTVPPWDPLTSALVRTVEYDVQYTPELRNGSMDPSSGNTTTVFNFTVEYWDANDDAPVYVYVNIDGVNHSMSKVDPGDTDYTDGCEYYYETHLSGGDHDYYFICNDSYETNSTSVETTGTIVPEFGVLPAVMLVGGMAVAVVWRRRRRA